MELGLPYGPPPTPDYAQSRRGLHLCRPSPSPIWPTRLPTPGIGRLAVPCTHACWVSSRLTPGFRCRAGAGTRRLSGPPRWLERGKFFGRGAARQSEGEAFIGVPGLPAPQGGGGRLEVREALPAPELLLIDPMAPFDLAVLLGPAGSDIPMADPGGFDPQHKGEGELLAVITLQALDGEREGRSELGQEGEARAVM